MLDKKKEGDKVGGVHGLAIISSLCSSRHCVAIGGVRVRILFYSTAELATGNRYDTDKTRGSPRAVNKTKVQQFTDKKNLLSAKK